MSQLNAQRTRTRWVYFITQAKTDLRCSTERDLALHLADPTKAANYLETIQKRPVSASGCMNVAEVTDWDGPAETARAFRDPSMTFVQFAEDQGEHLDFPFLPLLKARMKPGGTEVQLPLERLTMKIELGNPLKRPLPWLTDEESQESHNASGIGTTTSKATATTPIAFANATTDVLAAIASLSSKLDSHLKLADSQRKSVIDMERTLADLYATRGENIYLRTEVSKQRTELENRRIELVKANKELEELRRTAAKPKSAEDIQLSPLSDDPKPESFKDLLDYLGVDGEERPAEAPKPDELDVLEEGRQPAEEATAPSKKRRKPTTPSCQ